MWNNQYYRLLKDKDEELQAVIQKYNFYYAQIKDNKLKKQYNILINL